MSSPFARQLGCLAVEGPHDAELCYRLLSASGLKRVQRLSLLEPAFEPLVPTKFPHGDDLQKRMPVPLFLQNDQWAIAVHSAVGDSRLVNALEETLALLPAHHWAGVGLMLDADHDGSPAQRFDAVVQTIKAKYMGLPLPQQPGQVMAGRPRVGVYVLPDNQNKGTLEDLLLDSAELQFAHLLPLARQYVDDAQAKGQLPASHLADFAKPSGHNKAIVGAMSAVFRPGKAVQVSIQDNDWLRGPALDLPRIRAVQLFLQQLLLDVNVIA
ncbi:MAG: hypothetical protein Q8K34_10660 [Hydrogenophaga sp.]|jgi:hypothetical protein|uniref:DUF3226 domain-containing protein n=1 Tax=Hydrogenophaga sp. TaxID=1904254 RepID=UPI0027370820|nr:DUF3226 domain-containing protein [Hydrogenophaga sp.]MDP2220644.1 hypothetical protein [Hydrogenophaga sp.]MDP3344145.1 hypothetical protein [Hydrogenophaga sp.]MDP3808432.1 hypothetical protein [Hydrogenophaga sp.]